MNDNEEKIIQTKELPIVGFCALCDKPIFVGDDYERIEYYGNSDHKHLHKKDIVHGLAHKSCLEEKKNEEEQLNASSSKHNRLVLFLSILSGLVIAIGLMLIFIFSKAMHLALAIILPFVFSYGICSTIYILFTNNKFGSFIKKIIFKLAILPITINKLKQEKGWFIVIKIVLWIVLVPIAYIVIILISLLSMIISLILFPILLIKAKK